MLGGREPHDRPRIARELLAQARTTCVGRVVLFHGDRPPRCSTILQKRTSSSRTLIAGASNFSLFKSPQVDQDLTIGRTNPYPEKRQAAYDDLVHRLNSAAVYDWLYRTSYSLIAQRNVQGLDTPRTVSFGNYSPKRWLGDLWLTSGLNRERSAVHITRCLLVGFH